MKELKTNDVTISMDGEGFIGTRTLASLINIGESSLRYRIKSRKNCAESARYITNEINQLDEKSMIFALGYYASKGNEKASDLLIQVRVNVKQLK